MSTAMWATILIGPDIPSAAVTYGSRVPPISDRSLLGTIVIEDPVSIKVRQYRFPILTLPIGDLPFGSKFWLCPFEIFVASSY